MKLYLDERFLNKAVTRAAPGTDTKMPAPSPTFAGTSGTGSASRGGDVVGSRNGVPIYASEQKDRPGTGAASGFTGQTFKEFQKLSGAGGGQNIPDSGDGSQTDPNGSQQADPGYPEEVGDYHHTGVSPFSGVENHGKKIRTHDGVEHTILSHHDDPDTEGGQGWYAMQSTDSGGMSRMQAKKVHDYVNHMDSLHANTVRANHAKKEEKAQYEERQVARHGIEKTKKKEGEKPKKKAKAKGEKRKAVKKGLPSSLGLFIALEKAGPYIGPRRGQWADPEHTRHWEPPTPTATKAPSRYEKAKSISEALHVAGATKVLIVGGYVRDRLLGKESKDIDIEVYGIPYHKIVETLEPHHKVDVVGKAFGVVKVGDIDISVPRRENKAGVGHKGFDIQPDPTMTPREAALRRDFTVNSLASDFEGHIIDPFGGQKDLENKVLRATSEAFKEDPLRVLRGMQFAARFDMHMDPHTIEMCRSLADEYHTLPKERVFEEWNKWATKGVKPSAGLKILHQTGWIKHFPEIAAMDSVPQEHEWHPEGDVLIHTGLVCDEAVRIAHERGFSTEDRQVLVFAALCHDFGKPSTTKHDRGRWRAHGHAEAGVELTQNFLDSIGAPKGIAEKVMPLVKEHLAHASFKGEMPPPRTIRRLANRLHPANLSLWSALVEADVSGRPPLPKRNPVAGWEEAAKHMNIASGRPQPLVMGRHLIEHGHTPGPAMGVALKKLFEAQLDGKFSDVEGGLSHLQTLGKSQQFDLYVALDKAINWESGRAGTAEDFHRRHDRDGDEASSGAHKQYEPQGGEQDPDAPKPGNYSVGDRDLETGPGKKPSEGSKPKWEKKADWGTYETRKHKKHREMETPHGTYHHYPPGHEKGEVHAHTVTYTPKHSTGEPIHLKQHYKGNVEDDSYHSHRGGQHDALRTTTAVNELVKKHHEDQPAPGELSWKKHPAHPGVSQVSNRTDHGSYTVYRRTEGEHQGSYGVSHSSHDAGHGAIDRQGKKVDIDTDLGTRSFKTRREANAAATKHHRVTTKHDLGSQRELETGPGKKAKKSKWSKVNRHEWGVSGSGPLLTGEHISHEGTPSEDFEERHTEHGKYHIRTDTNSAGEKTHRVLYSPHKLVQDHHPGARIEGGEDGEREEGHKETRLQREKPHFVGRGGGSVPANRRVVEATDAESKAFRGRNFKSKKAAKAAVDLHHANQGPKRELEVGEGKSKSEELHIQDNGPTAGHDRDGHSADAGHGKYEIHKLSGDSAGPHTSGHYRATYHPKGTHHTDTERLADRISNTSPSDDAPRPHFVNPPTARGKLQGKKHSVGVLKEESRETHPPVAGQDKWRAGDPILNPDYPGHHIPEPHESEGQEKGTTSEVRHPTLKAAIAAVRDHHKEQQAKPKEKTGAGLNWDGNKTSTPHGEYSVENTGNGHQALYTPHSPDVTQHFVNPPNETSLKAEPNSRSFWTSGGNKYSVRPTPMGYPKNKMGVASQPMHSTKAQAQKAVEEHHKDRMAAATTGPPPPTPLGSPRAAPEISSKQMKLKFPHAETPDPPHERFGMLELSLAGMLDFYVDLNKGRNVLSKGVPTGTIHHWADGFSYRKMDDGEWQQVTTPDHPSHPDDGQGNPREGNFPVSGSEPVKNPWKARFAKYGIKSHWPPADASPDEVEVNLEGDVHSHAILIHRNLKTGNLVHAYTKEYEDRKSAQKWDLILRLNKRVHSKIVKGLRSFLQGKSGTKSARKAERDFQSSLIALTVVKTALRPGYEKQQDTRGVGSLRVSDVSVDGNTLRFDFIGKDKVRNIRVIKDKELATAFRKVLKGKAPNDRVFDQSRAANADRLLKRVTPDFTMKDFRSLRATEFAAKELENLSAPPPPLPGSKKAAKNLLLSRIEEVSEKVATYLNNTLSVARSSYIHPNVINAWVDLMGGADLMKGQPGSLLDHARATYDTVEPHTPLSESELSDTEHYALPDWLDPGDKEEDVSKGLELGIYLDSGFFKAVPEAVDVESAKVGKRRSIGVSAPSTPDRPDVGQDWHGDAEEETEESFTSPHTRVEAEKAKKGLDLYISKAITVDPGASAGKPDLEHFGVGRFQLNSPEELKKVLKKGHYSIISSGRNQEDPEEAKLPEDHPKFIARHEALRKDLERHGMRYTEGEGQYGQKELSFIVHHGGDKPPRPGRGAFMAHHTDSSEHETIRRLGKKHNQQSIIHSQEDQHEFHYVTGGKAGQHAKGSGHKLIPHADDYYTEIPHKHSTSKFTLNFDADSTGDWRMHPFDDAVYKSLVGDVNAHPHAYDWHDGHTDHHGLAKAIELHPHTSIPEHGQNTQVAGKGASSYGSIARKYGTVTPGKATNLNHYPGLEKQEGKLDGIIKEHGYKPYFAGGKYGKPDLANKNYNTGHLMIYDPTPQSGGDFGHEAFTRTWRKAHELSHALTYPKLNEKYGEGRRLGRLGVRSPREAKRAVHWEWMAAHKQRAIHEQLGHKVSDEHFHRELNTIMHDAVHRAIHGKFTEPSSEGFAPHSNKVPLEHSLGMIDDHARQMGLAHDDDTLKQKRQREAVAKGISEELRVGTREETEHTNNPEEAEKIAQDHLKKDPKYYTKLRAAGLIDKSFDLYVSL